MYRRFMWWRESAGRGLKIAYLIIDVTSVDLHSCLYCGFRRGMIRSDFLFSDRETTAVDCDCNHG